MLTVIEAGHGVAVRVRVVVVIARLCSLTLITVILAIVVRVVADQVKVVRLSISLSSFALVFLLVLPIHSFLELPAVLIFFITFVI